MSTMTMIGGGYVGLTTGACLADLGNHVTVLDSDVGRVNDLRQGRIPFFEPGLAEVVERNARAGRLQFCTSYSDAIPGTEFVFIAVGTPGSENGQANLDAVESAALCIAEHLRGPLIVVNKSTVPIGTGDLVSQIIGGRTDRFPVRVVSNPEFLREGSALRDFMEPDRVVIGARDAEAACAVAKLYQPLGARILTCDLYTAEMVKYASNAFLATRISFINMIGRICERVGADVRTVAEGMGLDERIGSAFLEAGIGFGGSCFPKDVKALAAIADQYGYHPELLHAVMAINREQRQLVITRLEELLGSLEGRTVGLLGLAFKPNTDDMREAPSLDIARWLQERGATVRAYDPVAGDRARPLLPGVEMVGDAYAAAQAAHAVVIVTEWNEFRQLDLERLRDGMRTPVLIDGRNIYDPAAMRGLGFQYRGIGCGTGTALPERRAGSAEHRAADASERAVGTITD